MSKQKRLAKNKVLGIYFAFFQLVPIMKVMMDNHSYNLMMQLVAESKSLKRIDGAYKEDAGDCGECKVFWEKMGTDKEDHIQELSTLIKNHL